MTDPQIIWGDGFWISDTTAIFDTIAIENKDLRLSMCHWLDFHGINPNLVPVPCTIKRDVAACTIIYPEQLLDEKGCFKTKKIARSFVAGEPIPFLEVEVIREIEVKVLQGETPPLPFPGFADCYGRTFEQTLDRLNFPKRNPSPDS